MDSTTAAVTGIPDTRETSLVDLARSGSAAVILKRVLPGEDQGRVPVAAFQSSI